MLLLVAGHNPSKVDEKISCFASDRIRGRQATELLEKLSTEFKLKVQRMSLLPPYSSKHISPAGCRRELRVRHDFLLRHRRLHVDIIELIGNGLFRIFFVVFQSAAPLHWNR
jgi:hypothetical protein